MRKNLTRPQTVSTLTTFVLAMCLYPEVQKRAQAEIDSLLGSSARLDRLPAFTDKEDLPYINALVKEVLRWIPVLPFAVPHRSMEDDIYEGHFIPKDSTVIGNAWYDAHRVDSSWVLTLSSIKGNLTRRNNISIS
jgi:cytochrome P450